jgi:hypothetical protein
MHVVVAVRRAHPARRSLCKRRNQPATWFQLANVRLTTFFDLVRLILSQSCLDCGQKLRFAAADFAIFSGSVSSSRSTALRFPPGMNLPIDVDRNVHALVPGLLLHVGGRPSKDVVVLPFELEKHDPLGGETPLVDFIVWLITPQW